MSATTLTPRSASAFSIDVAAALAEIVVDPDDRDRLGLHVFGHVFGDLRHGRLLAERGAEQELVAHLGELGRFAAHDLGDAGFGGERRGDLDRTGIAGAEQHVGIGVERLLHLGARDAGVGLRVGVGDDDLVAENAAGGVDLLDREVDAVLPVRADRRAAAGQFRHVGDLDVLGVTRNGEDERREAPSPAAAIAFMSSSSLLATFAAGSCCAGVAFPVGHRPHRTLRPSPRSGGRTPMKSSNASAA